MAVRRTTPKSRVIAIDASGKILGRLASEVAILLRGKDDPHFAPWKFSDTVVHVYNIGKIRVTGKKPELKIYWRHTQYPGGIKSERYKDVFAKDPRIVFQRAVRGMLPANRLRPRFLKHLKLSVGDLPK